MRLPHNTPMSVKLRHKRLFVGALRRLGSDVLSGRNTPRRVSAATVRRKPFPSKEKQIWVIRERRIKARKNNRKRPTLLKRTDDD